MENVEDNHGLLLNSKHVTACGVGFCQCHIRYDDFNLMRLYYIGETFYLMTVMIADSEEEEEDEIVENFENILDELGIVEDLVQAYINLKACFVYQSCEDKTRFLCADCGCEYIINDLMCGIHSFLMMHECYEEI